MPLGAPTVSVACHRASVTPKTSQIVGSAVATLRNVTRPGDACTDFFDTLDDLDSVCHQAWDQVGRSTQVVHRRSPQFHIRQRPTWKMYDSFARIFTCFRARQTGGPRSDDDAISSSLIVTLFRRTDCNHHVSLQHGARIRFQVLQIL